MTGRWKIWRTTLIVVSVPLKDVLVLIEAFTQWGVMSSLMWLF